MKFIIKALCFISLSLFIVFIAIIISLYDSRVFSLALSRVESLAEGVLSIESGELSFPLYLKLQDLSYDDKIGISLRAKHLSLDLSLVDLFYLFLGKVSLGEVQVESFRGMIDLTPSEAFPNASGLESNQEDSSNGVAPMIFIEQISLEGINLKITQSSGPMDVQINSGDLEVKNFNNSGRPMALNLRAVADVDLGKELKVGSKNSSLSGDLTLDSDFIPKLWDLKSEFSFLDLTMSDFNIKGQGVSFAMDGGLSSDGLKWKKADLGISFGRYAGDEIFEAEKLNVKSLQGVVGLGSSNTDANSSSVLVEQINLDGVDLKITQSSGPMDVQINSGDLEVKNFNNSGRPMALNLRAVADVDLGKELKVGSKNSSLSGDLTLDSDFIPKLWDLKSEFSFLDLTMSDFNIKGQGVSFAMDGGLSSDGLKWKKADLGISFGRYAGDEIFEAEKLNVKSLQGVVGLGSSNTDANSSSVLVEQINLDGVDLKITQSSGPMDVQINSGDLEVKNFNNSGRPMALNLRAVADVDLGKELKVGSKNSSLSGDLTLDSDFIPKLWDLKSEFSFLDLTMSDFNIKGQGVSFAMDGGLSSDGLKWKKADLGISFGRYAGDEIFEAEKLNVKSLQGVVGLGSSNTDANSSSVLVEQINLDGVDLKITQSSGPMDVQINSGDLEVKNFNNSGQRIDLSLETDVDMDMNESLDLASERFSLIGYLNLSGDFVPKSWNFRSEISSLYLLLADFSMKEKDFLFTMDGSLLPGKLNWGETSLRISDAENTFADVSSSSGSFDFSKGVKISGRLESKSIVVEKILELLKHDKEQSKAVPTSKILAKSERLKRPSKSNINVNLDLFIDEILYLGLISSNLRGRVRINADELHLSGLSWLQNGSQTSLNAVMQLHMHGPFNVDFSLSDFDISSLQELTKEPELKGKLDKVRIKLNGKKLHPFVEGSDWLGNMKINFSEVYLSSRFQDIPPFSIIFIPFEVISEIGGMAGILLPKSVTDLASDIAADLGESGRLYLKKGNINVDVKNSIFYISKSELNSDLLSVVDFHGSINFDQSLDMTVGIWLLGVKVALPISGTLSAPFPDLVAFAPELAKGFIQSIGNTVEDVVVDGATNVYQGVSDGVEDVVGGIVDIVSGNGEEASDNE